MAQDDPNKPKEAPPPIISSNPPRKSLEEEIAEQDAQAERDWELYELREQTKQLRALFANRAFIDPDGRHLRIAFGEKIGEQDAYHTAVVMPLEEAYELGELLMRMGGAGLQVMWERQRQFLAQNPSPLGDQGKGDG